MRFDESPFSIYFLLFKKSEKKKARKLVHVSQMNQILLILSINTNLLAASSISCFFCLRSFSLSPLASLQAFTAADSFPGPCPCREAFTARVCALLDESELPINLSERKREREVNDQLAFTIELSILPFTLHFFIRTKCKFYD